jgi:hypothetical protein
LPHALPHLENVAVDPQYWSDIAAYLKKSGVMTYEQDWLDSRATAEFRLDDQSAFMDNMASALAAAGITMEYCMPTPRHVLQGSKYSNLTTIRVSDDHFERSYWAQGVFASRLAASVGIWPWTSFLRKQGSMATCSPGTPATVLGQSSMLGRRTETRAELGTGRKRTPRSYRAPRSHRVPGGYGATRPAALHAPRHDCTSALTPAKEAGSLPRSAPRTPRTRDRR